MSAVMAHRGPDGDGEFFDEGASIGLAHRRLAILDVSDRGLQPMWSADRRFVIVFNGEIYNFQTLRRDLERRGRTFRTGTDTEVILEGFAEWGTDVMEKLDGIFALALWDCHSRTLVLARDEFGVKPLYYYRDHRGFMFASELKALRGMQGFDGTLDWDALGQYVSFMYCLGVRTPFLKVRRMLPGEVFVIRDGEITKQWRISAPPDYADTGFRTPLEWGKQIVGVLDRSVAKQMIADVTVGTFLSGGLDSSAITAFARQYATRGRLQSFTIGFREPGAAKREGVVEDLPYAEKAAAALGVDLHTIYVGADSAVDLRSIIYQLDEPIADPAAYNAWLIACGARKQGIKVLLSGAGGDDLFTGYRRHLAVSMEKRWAWMPRSFRATIESMTKMFPQDIPLLRRVTRAMQDASFSSDDRLVGYFMWIRASALQSVFRPEIWREMSPAGPAAEMLDGLRRLPSQVEPLNRMLFLDREFFLPDHNLNYTDKMSMAAGVEVRVPFLDRELARLAATIPVDLKQRGFEGKWILKQAMRPYLPEEIIFRPKAGFGVPLRSWMTNELREHVSETLSENVLRHSGVFDVAAVRNMVTLNNRGQGDYSYPLFAIMCIETWLQVFRDDVFRSHTLT